MAGEWIDTDRLLASARAAVDGNGPPAAGTAPASHVLRALAAGMFVARHA